MYIIIICHFLVYNILILCFGHCYPKLAKDDDDLGLACPIYFCDDFCGNCIL